MVVFEITDTKLFMNQLLRTELFDSFLLQEAVITVSGTYTINGRMEKTYYQAEELEELQLQNYPALPFSFFRDHCFGLIKGKKTPSYFKFIFLLSPANTARTLAVSSSSYKPNDISGIYMNLKYTDGKLSLTTGISYNIFSTDKTLEHEWDGFVEKFLLKNNIPYLKP